MQKEEIIHIAIVDDHTLFRQGVAHLLTEFKEIKIVFEASNGADMMEKLRAHTLPDVILMDIAMPVMDGYASTHWLKQQHPQIKVIALSMFEEDGPIIEMLKTGARGYILKESKPADLVTAIKTVYMHDYFVNEMVSGKLLRSIQDNHPPAKDIAKELTGNELKFLEWCCSELTYKEIAAKMNLSHHTIDNYRESLFQKFDTKSRTGLVVFAIKHHLIKI